MTIVPRHLLPLTATAGRHHTAAGVRAGAAAGAVHQRGAGRIRHRGPAHPAAGPAGRRRWRTGLRDRRRSASRPGEPALPQPRRPLDRLRSFALAIELGGEGRQWRLTPRRLIPGAGGLGPVEVVRTIRGLCRVADSYLRRRGLDRPGVPWAEYQDLAEPVAAGGYGRAS